MSEDSSRISDDHRAAMEGWKARKEQLHRQKELVDRINDDAEKVNLLDMSRKKKEVSGS
ncbi:MAG: hypothetical protein ABI347_07385 [Nitrososphaera sp.]